MNKQITRKRVWVSLMAIVFIFATMIPVFATETQTETEITLSGQGTSQDPYLIGTEAELLAFKEAVHADAAANSNVSSLCAKLTDDIVLATPWVPIAASNTSYKYGGTIDGDGHTISGMTTGKADVFGLVGNGTTNLAFKNLTIAGEILGTTYVSAFVGRPYDAVTFENCINKANVTGNADCVGGFIGNPQTYAHSFTNCANYGNITNTAKSTVGGFVGNSGSKSITYTNCANYGDVSGTGSGVVAGFSKLGTFVNCIGYGSVTNETGPATTTFNRYDGNSATNCFYRSGVTTAATNVAGGTDKTSSQFASGEVTYLMNGSTSENITWGQDLENDPYPVYGKINYPVYYIEAQAAYSNKNEAVGTVENPYLIGTEAQLTAFRELVNNGGTTLCAKLTDDIALTGTWSAISPVNTTNKYAGTFDGNGHTISNMKPNRPDVFGFVGEGGAGLTIKNLTLEGTFDKSGQTYTAGFVGRAHGAITFINCINKVDVTGSNRVAGFIGNGNSAHRFENCANYGDITGTNYVSGFLGTQGANLTATFINCANYGNITGSDGPSGIAQVGIFENCVGYGTVTVTDSTKLGFPAFNGWGNAQQVSHTNSYYKADSLVGSANNISSGNSKTAAQFASGEVTYLLNGSTAENATWGQELGVDSYPIPGKTDYPVYKFEYIYTNSSEPFGTESNPYPISTLEQLVIFKDLVNNGGTTLCARLTDDIALTGIWNPISPVNTTNKYAGTFDGNGHTISGLLRPNGSVIGFIGEGGEGLKIKNLTIEGTISGVDHAAAFVGRANGKTTFENCVNKVNISGTNNIGGFVGITSSEVIIKNCINYGNITGTKSGVSGFIGKNNISRLGLVENCVNYGNITGGTAAVEATDETAAVVAIDGAPVTGICHQTLNVKNCINVGIVTNRGGNDKKVCPITNGVGTDQGGTVTNSYYLDTCTNSTNVSSLGTPKTVTQFASGEVTYLINKNAKDIVCGQDLAADSYPIFGKDAMVWDNMGVYSNETGVFYAVDAEGVVLGATEGATAYIAQYNGKKLVDVTPVTITEELTENAITKNVEATSFRVFLWNENSKPLCADTEIAFDAN